LKKIGKFGGFPLYAAAEGKVSPVKHILHRLMAGPRRGVLDSVPLALAWRYGTHSLMVLINFLNEPVAAPTLHDRILSVTPFIPIIAKTNYHLWLLCYVPVALWLWYENRAKFVEFLYVGGVVSLLRALCIWLTILGPVNGRDVNAGRPWSEMLAGWFQIVNPFSAVTTDAMQVYLTKDLFFSGHTASTFLLLLYCWKYPRIRPFAIAGHVIVVASVFFSHLHYSIDVVGGWAIAFCAYAAAEKFFGRPDASKPVAHSK